MNLLSSLLPLAQGSGDSSVGWLAGLGVLVLLFLLIIIWANRFRKVGPNEVMIVFGKQHRGESGVSGFRVVKGGGTFVWPILEDYKALSLELMTIDVRTPEVYTITGVPIRVDGVAQVKVRGDETAIRTASERFLSMTSDQIKQIALQTLEGHLRAIVGTLTVEQIYKERDAFAQQVQTVASEDMANMGLTIDSFTLRDIKDDEGYLDALGKPRIAQVKRDAIIAQAEADRDATIKSAQANQAGQEAKFLADAEIAKAQRDYELKKAEYQASVNTKTAEADLAYDLQKFKTGQLVKAEELQVAVIEKEKMTEVQAKEIERKQKELESLVNKPADAEKYRIQALADAQKYKIAAEAAGQAEAQRNIGEGEADANRARGLAQAEVIKAQGYAEAEAMEKKASAWQDYNQAAVIQMVIDKFPAIASAIAQPLSKTEKITIVSTGGDGGAGASKITKDVTDVVAQLPPILEALSGVNLQELVKALPALKKASADKKA